LTSSLVLYLFFGATTCVCASAASGIARSAKANTSADRRRVLLLLIFDILIPSASHAPRRSANKIIPQKLKSGTPLISHAGGRAARSPKLQLLFPPVHFLSKPRGAAQERGESVFFRRARAASRAAKALRLNFR